jgi:hypothetical protein
MKPQPSEFRIGNLVKYDGRIFKMYSICPDYPFLDTTEFGVGVVEWKDIEAIPLTEDWLLKFGFKQLKENNSYPEDFAKIIYDNGRMRIYGNTIEWIESNDDYFFKIINTPKFVHQLQNLYFALTGEELEIKEGK